MAVKEKTFWSEGLRFECQGTGRCCTSRGEYGFVYVSASDRKRIAAALGLDTRTFTRKYCTKSEGWFHLNNPERDCQFLEGKRCGIYSARPTQCRTWPFWPEHMTPRGWSKEVASFCPGVGKGRLHSADEIRAALEQDAQNAEQV